MGFGQS